MIRRQPKVKKKYHWPNRLLILCSFWLDSFLEHESCSQSLQESWCQMNWSMEVLWTLMDSCGKCGNWPEILQISDYDSFSCLWSSNSFLNRPLRVKRWQKKSDILWLREYWFNQVGFCYEHCLIYRRSQRSQ